MTTPENNTTCDWTVLGMDCGSCASKVKDAVGRLPGVSNVEVGLMSERLRLTLDEAQTGRDKIESVVKSLGYGIAPRGAGANRIEDPLIIIIGCQHQNTCLGKALADLARGLNPIHHRHTQIHEHDIGLGLGNQVHRLGAIAGNAHHGKVAHRAQNHTHPLRHNILVITQQ